MQCRLGWFCHCQCVDKEEAKNRRRWRHYAAVETEASSIIHCYWRHINSEPFRDRFLLKKSLVVLSGKISSLLSVNGHRIMLSYKTLNVINSWVCYLQQYVQVHVDRQSLLLLAEGTHFDTSKRNLCPLCSAYLGLLLAKTNMVMPSDFTCFWPKLIVKARKGREYWKCVSMLLMCFSGEEWGAGDSTSPGTTQYQPWFILVARPITSCSELTPQNSQL